MLPDEGVEVGASAHLRVRQHDLGDVESLVVGLGEDVVSLPRSHPRARAVALSSSVVLLEGIELQHGQDGRRWRRSTLVIARCLLGQCRNVACDDRGVLRIDGLVLDSRPQGQEVTAHHVVDAEASGLCVVVDTLVDGLCQHARSADMDDREDQQTDVVLQQALADVGARP